MVVRFSILAAIVAAHPALAQAPATKPALAQAPATKPAATAPRPATPALPRATFIANMDLEFRKLDVDRNGLASTREIEESQRTGAAAEAQSRSRALFAELDRDRNGVLAPAEFAAMQDLRPRADAEPMLRRFDANRDRSISLIEHRAATLRNFDRLDTDMDGLVTQLEMRAGGTPR